MALQDPNIMPSSRLDCPLSLKTPNMGNTGYIMNVDGSGVSRLTDNSANDEHPDWSPDGRRIAFISDRDGDYEIYVMNADGSDVIQLTDNSTDDVLPSWSPR